MSLRLTADERSQVSDAPAPAGADAMKAVLCRTPFSNPEWIFERKLDGIRCVAIRDGERLRMLSRNDLDLDGRFPEVRDALAAQASTRFAVDGEVVAFHRGRTSFARLADRGRHAVAVFYYIFDLVWLDGVDLRALPLRTRKRLLREALSAGGPIRLSTHRNGEGEAMFRHACAQGWEGVIAKRADSPYRASRSRDWLKFKCEAGQELVIGGFTAPRGSRSDFGALLLGYHDPDGALRYAGKVGTGFDQDTLAELGARLRALARPDSPFSPRDTIRERAITWVAPTLVAQLAFTEWTRAGRLRHPRFLGLREDKSAGEVVRER
ncbi:MAG TPA: non-homologous end-joining DNA ligase [Solirubrobacteraceae bacterium]|nr:non-homologous end-joining DNA ligase [Solirubrobacteraceae bacterium]